MNCGCPVGITGQRQAVQTFVMDGPISQHHTVRQSYDAVAEECVACFREELAGKPLNRALLACLAEEAEDGAPVADLGCGPGHVAAWLAGRGVASVGIDLSPAMIAVGRRDYPRVEFREGDFLGLPAATVSSGLPSRSIRSSIFSLPSWPRHSARSIECYGPARYSWLPFISARR
jgi:SAM-dependent methyltransferase